MTVPLQHLQVPVVYEEHEAGPVLATRYGTDHIADPTAWVGCRGCGYRLIDFQVRIEASSRYCPISDLRVTELLT
ncbi:MAG: hypothetical protein ACI80N_002188 [Gammaproteobacteria bacterium]|jgi:hypothetical protein